MNRDKLIEKKKYLMDLLENNPNYAVTQDEKYLILKHKGVALTQEQRVLQCAMENVIDSIETHKVNNIS